MNETLLHPIEKKRLRVWAERLLFSFMIGIVTIALLFLVSIAYNFYLNDPSITFTNMDTPDLGILCPDQQVDVHAQVRISEPIITIYYISVMDSGKTKNIIGTQRAFTDNLYPYPTEFESILPWKVPDLPPGKYQRVVAVRDVTSLRKTLFTSNTFTIGENCHE